MRPVARQSARLASYHRTTQQKKTRTCICELRRTFTSSFPREEDPRSPSNPTDSQTPHSTWREQEKKPGDGVAREEPQGAEQNEDQRLTDQSPNAFGRRRTLRQKAVNDVPKPPPIPEWFFERNVQLSKGGNLENTQDPDERACRCIDPSTGHVLFTIRYLDPRWDVSYRSRKLFESQKVQPPGRDSSHAEQAPTVAPTLDAASQTKTPEKGIDSDAQRSKMHPLSDLTFWNPGLPWHSSTFSGVRWTFLEAEASIRAAFSLADCHRRASSFAADRVDLSLQCVDLESHEKLDSYVQSLADIVQADLIRLDANDFAELMEEYVGHGHDEPGSVSALGYEVYSHLEHSRSSAGSKTREKDEDDEEEEDDNKNQPLVDLGNLRGLMQAFAGSGGARVVGIGVGSAPLEQSLPGSPRTVQSRSGSQASDAQRNDERVSAFLNQLLDAARQKRSRSNPGDANGDPQSPTTEMAVPTLGQPEVDKSRDSSDSSRKSLTLHEMRLGFLPRMVSDGRNNPLDRARTQITTGSVSWAAQNAAALLDQLALAIAAKEQEPPVMLTGAEDASFRNSSSPRDVFPPTIVHIRDLRDMYNSRLGAKLVHRLVEAVRKRRRLGEKIVVVGTTAQDVPGPIPIPGDHSDPFPFRTLNVPRMYHITHPAFSRWQDILKDYRREPTFPPLPKRILEINLRHIQSMLRRLRPGEDVDMLSERARSQIRIPDISCLEERVLSQDDVQRMVLFAIGLTHSIALADTVHPIHIALAAHLSIRADHWAAEMAKLEQPEHSPFLKKDSTGPHAEGSGSREGAQARMDRLKKICNQHEARFLSSMVDPTSIKSGFADVHAPTETIDALKSLTTLALLRPDAFKYGVLASDRLPGLLLYGPPGTGKTLLAKAVAKESQATVLEVSGAQIYQKWVGEGEKMVQAVFSLAKKLSPCVVFIDEADAIFGSRGNAANRTTHREIINQFLREWDGMDDHGVFIMVATNRPFDLDDAVLRRLPRRLLVDLPVAKDRESILGIHLKNEALDASVSLNQLAERTPFYSGSDLKNVAVAAALACVREENELSAANRETADFKLPEKRTLTSQHFDQALTEISASISEDMSSLNAIRKFDEQFGDRKGRRKKSSYGFGTSDEAINEQLARVRQTPPTTTASPPL